MRLFAAHSTDVWGELFGVCVRSLSRGDADNTCIGPRRLATSRKDSQNAPIATLGMRGRNSAGISTFSRPPEALRAT
jgi:hypothetical protein